MISFPQRSWICCLIMRWSGIFTTPSGCSMSRMPYGLWKKMFHYHQKFHLPRATLMTGGDFGAQHMFWLFFSSFHSPHHHTYVYCCCQSKILPNQLSSWCVSPLFQIWCSQPEICHPVFAFVLVKLLLLLFRLLSYLT